MTRVHVVHIYLHVSYTHNHMVENLYNTKFIVVNMTEIVANDKISSSDHRWLKKIFLLSCSLKSKMNNICAFFCSSLCYIQYKCEKGK